MSQTAQAIRRRRFGDVPNDWQTYHALIAKYLRDGDCVLDIGCGSGRTNPFPWQEYPKVVLHGIDPDEQAAANPNLTRFGLIEDPHHWPVEDGSIDLALARYVLEHVAGPQSFFENLRRVLRPGGRFVFLCPNKFRPLSALARVVPEAWTLRLLRGMRESDVFPTCHRANCAGALRRLARQFGFEIEHLAVREFEPPPWLARWLPAYLLGLGYHGLVTATRLDRLIGSNIHGVMRRS